MDDPVTRTEPYGYSLPLSPTGAAAMVTPPPWHFSGEVVMVEYRADPDAVARHLPPGLEPGPDAGAAAAVWAQWQWCSDSGDELEAPERCQFAEFLILLACQHRGVPVVRCPYAWVDSAVSLVRGWIQGMPKQFGEINQTRAVPAGRAGPPMSGAGTFNGVASVFGQRIARGAVHTRTEHGDPPPLFALPLVHSRLFPGWVPGEEPVTGLVASQVTDVTFTGLRSGPADLWLTDDPAFADLGSLAPREVGTGTVFSYGETLVGGRCLA
ncbi:enduracididine biosynthesis enzyme MppR [Micromonospora fiedleri]|nr:enduracididine biosynthesis enzyme MppR [Micromonospora fiedleri]MBL6279278.1 enduracididine biosynthesis enzyme MppR [Micromonospora fiedleri]